MDKKQEEVCINAANEVLSSSFSRTCFSTNGAKESAACLEKENDSWIVYGYERGNRFSVAVFQNIVDACVELIRRIAINNNYENVLEKFYAMIVKESVA